MARIDGPASERGHPRTELELERYLAGSAMRMLYLTAGLRSIGSEYFWGRKLFERLRQHCVGEPLLAHAVWADAWSDAGDDFDERWSDQVVSERAFRAFAANLIVIEGGLFEIGTGRWRVPRELLRSTISGGGVVIAADNHRSLFEDEACWEAFHANEGWTLTGAVARRDQLYEQHLGGRVQYLGDPDNTGAYGTLICHPERMIIPDTSVMPTFEGVDRLAVSRAVAIVPHGIWLATGNESTTGALLKDTWVDRSAHLPWAAASQLDAGFMVFISGIVTRDRLLEQGNNDIWLTNVATFLLDAIEKEEQARAPLRRLNEALAAGQDLATYLDADAAGEVSARLAEEEAEEEVRSALKREDAIPAAEEALRDVLDADLDAIGEHGRRSLVAAELSRRQLDGFAGDDLEYAGATHLYSRTLEIELHERLFEPFRTSGRNRLPETATDEQLMQSVNHLGKFLRTGKPLALGTMALILIDVGHKLADAEPNDFAAFLRERLTADAPEFCSSWPRQVNSYVDLYRNRGAHTGRLSRDDCVAARAFLLDEPRRLLGTLLTAAPIAVSASDSSEVP